MLSLIDPKDSPHATQIKRKKNLPKEKNIDLKGEMQQVMEFNFENAKLVHC
jgi:hypothetical protein